MSAESVASSMGLGNYDEGNQRDIGEWWWDDLHLQCVKEGRGGLLAAGCWLLVAGSS